MKIFVNNKEFTLFAGAKVKDAVLIFDRKILREIASYEVLDKYGYQTDIDGALQEGTQLFIQKLNDNHQT
jgi:hypothetical protein